MKRYHRRDFIKYSSFTIAYLATTSKSLSALNVVYDAPKVIKTGEKTTIKTGDVINYINLPNQPIALIIYNNTGGNTQVSIRYKKVTHIRLASVSDRDSGLGQVFLLNPSVTQKNDITISIPHTESADSLVDVYCVSALYPTNTEGINSFEINDEVNYFQNYSKAYATPQFAWYTLSIQMGFYGFIGLLFEKEQVSLIGININTSKEVIDYIKRKIFFSDDTGIYTKNITFDFLDATRYDKTFYGDSSQIVFASISSLRTIKNCSISLEKLS